METNQAGMERGAGGGVKDGDGRRGAEHRLRRGTPG